MLYKSVKEDEISRLTVAGFGATVLQPQIGVYPIKVIDEIYTFEGVGQPVKIQKMMDKTGSVWLEGEVQLQLQLQIGVVGKQSDFPFEYNGNQYKKLLSFGEDPPSFDIFKDYVLHGSNKIYKEYNYQRNAFHNWITAGLCIDNEPSLGFKKFTPANEIVTLDGLLPGSIPSWYDIRVEQTWLQAALGYLEVGCVQSQTNVNQYCLLQFHNEFHTTSGFTHNPRYIPPIRQQYDLWVSTAPNADTDVDDNFKKFVFRYFWDVVPV